MKRDIENLRSPSNDVLFESMKETICPTVQQDSSNPIAFAARTIEHTLDLGHAILFRSKKAQHMEFRKHMRVEVSQTTTRRCAPKNDGDPPARSTEWFGASFTVQRRWCVASDPSALPALETFGDEANARCGASAFCGTLAAPRRTVELPKLRSGEKRVLLPVLLRDEAVWMCGTCWESLECSNPSLCLSLVEVEPQLSEIAAKQASPWTDTETYSSSKLARPAPALLKVKYTPTVDP